jgi:hypothetical protein
LASEDVRVVQRIATEIRPVLRQGALTTDLQNILDWWRVAELVYTSRKDDIATYGSAMDKLGTTMEAKQGVDERTKILISVWGKINETVPSSEQKWLAAMSPIVNNLPHPTQK